MDIAIENRRLSSVAISGKAWIAVVLACTAAGFAGALWNWYWVLAPLILMVTMLSIVRPIWGIYLLISFLFLPYLVVSEVHAIPADLILVLVVIGFWLHRAQEGKLGVVRTPVDVPIFMWLAIMAISLLNAYDLQRGAINWLRHLQLFLLFYVVATLPDARQSRRLVELLTAITAVMAISNILPFVQSGGTERVFGTARISLSGILTLVIVYVTARICFEPRRRLAGFRIGLLGLLILGQIANQSRAAIGLSALGIIIVLITVLQWGRVHSELLPRQRARQLVMIATITVLLAVTLAPTLFQGLADRFAAIGNAETTLHFRAFLWKTAVASYLEHPIVGIGLGQVQVWQHFIPALRLQPLGSLTFGLGTHLSFLKYLAETGTIGATILLWLLAGFGLSSFRAVRRITSVADAGHVIGVSAVVWVIILRVFIEGHFFYQIMGMTSALFFGLLVNILNRQLARR